MKQDFSELIEYLDKRFSAIDKVLEGKAEKKDLRILANAVDAYAKRADAYFQEMVMLSHRVDRIERNLKKLAEKVGLKLD